MFLTCVLKVSIFCVLLAFLMFFTCVLFVSYLRFFRSFLLAFFFCRTCALYLRFTVCYLRWIICVLAQVGRKRKDFAQVDGMEVGSTQVGSASYLRFTQVGRIVLHCDVVKRMKTIVYVENSK